MKYKTGFTMLETVIGISLFSLVIVAVIALITASGYGLKKSNYQLLTSVRVENIKEWLWGEKEKSWNDFVNKASPPQDYCLEDNFTDKFITDLQPINLICLTTPTHFRQKLNLSQTQNGVVKAQIDVEYLINDQVFANQSLEFSFTQHD